MPVTPRVPIQTPMFDELGNLTRTWIIFFERLGLREAAAVAPPAEEARGAHVIGWDIQDAAAGLDVSDPVIPVIQGGITRCQIRIKETDITNPLKIDIRNNGSSIFDVQPLLPAGSNCCTVYSFPTKAVTIMPEDDVVLDIVQGGTWQFAAYLPYLAALPPEPPADAEFTPPVDTDFTWMNQDSATTATTPEGVFLQRAGGGGDSVRGRIKTIPFAPPRQLTCAFLPNLQAANYGSFGIFIADAGAAPKLHFYCYSMSTSQAIRDYRFNSPTGFSGSVGVAVPFIMTSPMWLRIRDDGTNLIFSWSSDGENFLQALSVARTAFLAAPAQWGFGMNSIGLSLPTGGTIIHWKEENV